MRIRAVQYILLIAVLFSCATQHEYDTIPEFPIPAPTPSNSELDLQILDFLAPSENPVTLGDIDYLIVSALKKLDYTYRYFSVEGRDGFVIITRLERYLEDGCPAENGLRWQQEVGIPRNILDAIICPFYVEPGYYRVMAFIITNKPYSTNAPEISREEANEWLKAGGTRLPSRIASLIYTSDFQTDVLIYEYKKPGRGLDPIFLSNSALSANDHLEKSGIINSLSN